MKQIIAIVKPFRAQAVLEAIGEFDVDTVLVCEAQGLGRQKEYLSEYVGSEYNPVQLPKIEITILVADDAVEPLLARIIEVARTGRIGDGKILVFSVLADVNI